MVPVLKTGILSVVSWVRIPPSLKSVLFRMTTHPPLGSIELPTPTQKVPSKKVQPRLVGLIYGRFSTQNTIFTLTDLQGQVKAIVSNGLVGYKNSKSKTHFATQAAAERLGRLAKGLGFYSVTFIMKGKNKGRKKCVRTFQRLGLLVPKLYDWTPISHNGCRPPKPPRR